MNTSGPSGIDPLIQSTFGLTIGKGDRRKLSIIEGAIQCLGERGIEGSTLEMIARRARVSNPHVLYYFKNKDGVIEAAIKYITIRAQGITIAAVQEALTPSERLRAFIEAAFDWAQAHPEQARVMTAYHHYCAIDPRYRATHSDIRKTGRARAAALVAEALAERGLAAGGATCDRIAGAIQQLITGAILDAVTTDGESLEELKRATVLTSEKLLNEGKKR